MNQNSELYLAEAFLHHAGGPELRGRTPENSYPAALCLRVHRRGPDWDAHHHRHGWLVYPHAGQDAEIQPAPHGKRSAPLAIFPTGTDRPGKPAPGPVTDFAGRRSLVAVRT